MKKLLRTFNNNNLVVPIIGEINWESTRVLVEEVMSSLAQRHFNKATIFIGSSGGDIDASWCLYDTFNALTIPVATVGLGKVYSAAVVPFMVGKERYMFPTSTMLFHPTVSVFEKTERNLKELEEEINCQKVDIDLIRKVLAGKVPEDMLQFLSSPNQALFLTADECVKLKLATKKINNYDDIR